DKLARDNVSGIVVPIAGKVLDGDLRAGEARLDEPLDLVGIHGHWARPSASNYPRHHKPRHSLAATPQRCLPPAPIVFATAQPRVSAGSADLCAGPAGEVPAPERS